MAASNLIRIYEGEKIAEIYSKHRYAYPPLVAETIMNYLRKIYTNTDGNTFEYMLDVGCGTGRSTHAFSPFFKSILGIDISEAQIEQAKKINESDNIIFKLSDGHTFPVDDDSVDLVTCGAAAHWLDIKKFEEECERVLKPNGCCAIYISTFQDVRNLVETDDKVKPGSNSHVFRTCLREFLDDINAHERNYIAHDGYQDIFDRIHNTSKEWLTFRHEREYTLDKYRAYARSINDYNIFIDKEKPIVDPIDVLAKKIKKTLGKENEPDEEVKVIIEYEYRFIMLTKSNTGTD
uniref:putative methyltransferase DDB_G0268948 n=1 Tax=Styela clava TaxID=7725 RepID=UPI001939C74F|nr:putative methyltransferase DDB_G0268948 [Styela clava]